MTDHSLIVVLDAMGVIYQFSDDVSDLLIPFLREGGCLLPTADVRKCYTDCSSGLCTTAELWRRLGLTEEAARLNQRYLQRYKLTQDLMPFLRKMHSRKVRVGCISNDCSEWSVQLRRNFRLEQYFFNWTISGDVHSRKPDPAIYKHFVEKAAVDPQRCLFVDDRVKNLDAACRLGFKTVLLSRCDDAMVAGLQHEVAKNFTEVEQCRNLLNHRYSMDHQPCIEYCLSQEGIQQSWAVAPPPLPSSKDPVVNQSNSFISNQRENRANR